MEELSENQIKKTLIQNTIKPSKVWQSSTIARLELLEKKKPNNFFINTFYFLSLYNMTRPVKIASLTIVASAVLLTSGAMGVSAAQNATPGSPLFGLDKAIENVQRTFTTTPEAKSALESNILQERVQELEQLKDSNANDDTIKSSINEVDEQRGNLEHALAEVEKETSTNSNDNAKANAKKVLQDQLEKLQDVDNKSKGKSFDTELNKTVKGFKDDLGISENETTDNSGMQSGKDSTQDKTQDQNKTETNDDKTQTVQQDNSVSGTSSGSGDSSNSGSGSSGSGSTSGSDGSGSGKGSDD